MATLTHLTGGSTQNVDTVDTASISPTANRPVFAIVSSSIGGGSPPATPTVSGAGLTWAAVPSAVRTFTDGVTASGRVTVFRGISASPSTGALTIGFSAVTQQGILWTVLDGEDCDAVVQAINAGGTSTTAGGTLSSFGSASNATLAVVATLPDTVTFTPDGSLTGFTPQSNNGVNHRAAWLGGEDTTPSFTLSVSQDWAFIGLEIEQVAAAEPYITLQFGPLP